MTLIDLDPDLRSAWARKVGSLVAAGESIVELGCGVGVPVAWLLSDRYDYTGVDISPAMIRSVGDVLPGASLLCADMHDVDFAPQTVGAVVAFFSIRTDDADRCHELFTSIAAWLRPGGVFAASVIAPATAAIPTEAPNATPVPPETDGPGAAAVADAGRVRELLIATGFEVLESSVVAHWGGAKESIPVHWFLAKKR